MFKLLNKSIKRICLLGNQHGLLQYLLLSSLEEINQTFFLWNYVSIHHYVIRKFGKQGIVIPEPRKKLTDLRLVNLAIKYIRLFYDYYILYPLKYPFVLNYKLDYWGHDHVYNAHCFLREHPFRLLEDGTLNYVSYPYPQPQKRFLWFKRMLAGKNYSEYKKYAGSESLCKEIFLTGLLDSGEVLHDPRVKIKSFLDMWEESSSEKRAFINYVFGVSVNLIEKCKEFRHILLTDPFSEDDVISEMEKIDLVRNIIERIGQKDLLIKPHPREKTDYSKYFPDIYVLKTYAPMQLLSLNGVRFDAAYSILSTALFDFPYRIKVCAIGSEIHPVLYEKFPDWSSDKIKKRVSDNNIELFSL